jgi:hypothetical protein
MDMANFIIKMVACMMEIGNKIKWKGLGNFIISPGNLPMRVSG